MRRFLAFFVRDFHQETSYRLAFGMSIVGILFTSFTFYFLSEFMGPVSAEYLGEYDGDYFSYVLIGIAFGSYFSVGLTSFASALRQAQTTGTLEALLMTPTPVSTVVVGSALWSYTFTTFRVLVYLLVGTLLLGVSLSGGNVAAALVGLLLAIVAFASIGIIAAGIIMVVKRGDPITTLFASVANLVGGVYYPIEILPDWLQVVAKLLPITYALRIMRLSLLADASWAEVAPDMLVLTGFCVVLFPLSLVVFRLAVQRARQEGSLAHY